MMREARGPRPRRGVALLVVLWTVAMLATLTAVASSAARRSADITSARRAGSIARAMAESGLLLASARIDNELRAAGTDTVARARVLDGLEPAATRQALAADTLGDGVFAVTVVDVSARLDVNAAGADGWYLLLRRFTGDAEARAVAARIDVRVRGIDAGSRGGAGDVRGTGGSRDDIDARDSLVAALLGREVETRRRGRIETIDELLEIPGVDPALLLRIAPLLTVDGNGYVNRRAAPAAVVAAASGSLVDHPVRLLVVSRGWMRGHPLTREIEAVYDVTGDELRLVRWRERER
jgi:general secretion pathway protein K